MTQLLESILFVSVMVKSEPPGGGALLPGWEPRVVLPRGWNMARELVLAVSAL